MAFITIPVYWYEGDQDSLENLKKPPTSTLGDLVVNTDHIVSYHEDDAGMVMIRCSNGDVFRTPMDYAQFVKDYPQLLSRLDIIISAEN